MTRTREREKPELLTLHNGKTVTIRRLEPTDAPHLINVFDHLSADSRYHRFNVVLDHPDPAYVRQQAEMIAQSVVNGRGFLAFDGPDPVGGARYVRVDDDSAEIALSFRDDYQAQGLGTHLLRKLVKTAREDGYAYLIGIAQDGNKGLWALLDKIDKPFTRTPDHGFSSFTITL